MVEDQLVRRGINDRRVLEAMGVVPREEFVPAELRGAAYEDAPQLIGAGQTISQPYTVAFMLQSAELSAGERVMEVGTGSGYGAAVLAAMGASVHTVERIPALAEQAAERLARLGYANAKVHCCDGTLGLPDEAPFDAIIVTAGAAYLPPAYEEQLTEGGRIVIPIGRHLHYQQLYRCRKTGGQLSQDDLGAFAFVPLIGAEGWAE
jgi:protein-L-isoaspartate(D-aspartate) O-methyltransferase